MNKRMITAMMAVMFFFVTAQAMAATTLRFQCAYPENANVGKTTLFFADEVARLTNNQVIVKVFWPGQLIKTNEAFDAVIHGMIDGYTGSLQYFSGKVPEVNVQWLPFNWANAQEAKDVLVNRGYMKVMDEAMAKHGVTYLSAMSVANMGLLTKFPVEKIEDLKGKKIRAVGMEAKVIEAFGASAVALAGAEQYMALQRGTVDGTDYPWYTVEQYKFYEVVNYIVIPALHTPGVVDMIINSKAFNGLSAEHQKAVRQAALSAGIDKSFADAEALDKNAIANAPKLGVKISVIPEANMGKFRDACKPLWDAEAEKSPHSARLVNILKEHLKSKGIN